MSNTIDILAQDFYTTSYQKEMGLGRVNKTPQSWLSEQTGGLFEEQDGNIKPRRETILALASTVCFKAKWIDEFSKKKTMPQTFHTLVGDVETDFMHQRDTRIYYWGDKFSAVCQSFKGSGAMWFLLPDEDVPRRNCSPTVRP